MPMCRARSPMSTPLEVIVRHVEVIEPDAELEARLRRFEEAERKGLVRFDGIYERGRTYQKGMIATWGGSLWHANRETDAEPGQTANHEDWTLIVRRGRNGKDRKVEQ